MMMRPRLGECLRVALAPRCVVSRFSMSDRVVAVAPGEEGAMHALQAAWLNMAREVLAQTEDVGGRFAEEARRIHYGETKRRGIRGQASSDETQALLEEGISVMPLPLPHALKGTLQ